MIDCEELSRDWLEVKTVCVCVCVYACVCVCVCVCPDNNTKQSSV